MYIHGLQLVFFGLLGFQLSFGCKCVPPHPQKAFCEAEFVVKGNVLSYVTDGNERTYTIAVERFYKPRMSSSPIPIAIFVQTAESSAACGVQMNVNETWLLAGSLESNVLSVVSCGWNRLFSEITPAQERGIKGEYAGSRNRNCKSCELQYCRDPDTPCSNITSKHTCPWPDHGCQDDVCWFKKGKCIWRRDCYVEPK